jgi:hypothetical protein
MFLIKRYFHKNIMQYAMHYQAKQIIYSLQQIANNRVLITWNKK